MVNAMVGGEREDWAKGKAEGADRRERIFAAVEIDFDSSCKVNIYYAKSYRMSKILSSKY